ncbi:MAG: hypothetical protein OEV29_05645 [Thermoleophilia bacterium]|nr:hypothetical protein [Thermoleophilia bacterium]
MLRLIDTLLSLLARRSSRARGLQAYRVLLGLAALGRSASRR